MPRVVVSIPTYKDPGTLARAVNSVLSQSMPDLAVVVSNDGGDAPALDGIHDRRLTVVNHSRNRGRYWADAEVLRTADADWFTVCDADDWVEPGWLEGMLAAADGNDMVTGPHINHGLTGAAQPVEVRRYTGRFTWHAHMGASLFSTRYLRQTGLLTGAVRVGWDNVVTGFPHAAAAVTHHSQACYHRVTRPGSLTQARATGMRSAFRAATVELLRGVWADLLTAPDAARCIIGSLEHERTAAELVRGLPETAWTMQRAALVELDAYLWREAPRLALECGSGLSTVVLANYARLSGARVVSLEHDPRHRAVTLNLLRSHGLEAFAEVRQAPLSGAPPMYQTDLPDGVDFVLIDGPPEGEGGREATLGALMPHLAPGWTAWLDDGARPLERRALATWTQRHGIVTQPTRLPHDPVVIRPAPEPHPPQGDTGGTAGFHVTPVTPSAALRDPSDVTVAVLTGLRPELLARTLDSLPGWLTETAQVVVLHDGGDAATSEVLDRHAARIDRLVTRRHPSQPMHTIGDNWSVLASLVETEYFLPLEDDWVYVGLDDGWLGNAVEALQDGYAQVRLRHVGDNVSPVHAVTRAPLDWSPVEYGWAAEAHLTLNPSLMRAADLAAVFPADGETHLQRRALGAGLRCVVQAYPGVWMHVGDRSMRAELRPPP